MYKMSLLWARFTWAASKFNDLFRILFMYHGQFNMCIFELMLGNSKPGSKSFNGEFTGFFVWSRALNEEEPRQYFGCGEVRKDETADFRQVSHAFICRSTGQALFLIGAGREYSEERMWWWQVWRLSAPPASMMTSTPLWVLSTRRCSPTMSVSAGVLEPQSSSQGVKMTSRGLLTPSRTSPGTAITNSGFLSDKEEDGKKRKVKVLSFV